MADFDAGLDLLRRLNPKNTSKSLEQIITIAPQLADDLLESVDVPLGVRKCKRSGREYLTCDYNVSCFLPYKEGKKEW